MALNGGPSDERIVRLVATIAAKTKAELIAVHVVEIDWTLPLDADIAGRSEDVQRVLDMAEAIAESHKLKMEPVLLQARDVAAAIVDEATERDADLLVVGLPYRKRFGGEFAIGRTVPYILQNAPCAVWVVREPMSEGAIVKIVIVGCGRVGASAAEIWDEAGHEVVILDVSTRAFERLPSTFGGTAIRGDGTDEDVLRRAGAEGADVLIAVTEGDNRNVMSAQLAVEAFEHPAASSPRSTTRSAPRPTPSSASRRCAGPGLMVDALNAHLGLPPSGLAGMLAPTGTHPGGEHHAARATRATARLGAERRGARGTGTDHRRTQFHAAPGAVKEA